MDLLHKYMSKLRQKLQYNSYVNTAIRRKNYNLRELKKKVYLGIMTPMSNSGLNLGTWVGDCGMVPHLIPHTALCIRHNCSPDKSCFGKKY